MTFMPTHQDVVLASCILGAHPGEAEAVLAASPPLARAITEIHERIPRSRQRIWSHPTLWITPGNQAAIHFFPGENAAPRAFWAPAAEPYRHRPLLITGHDCPDVVVQRAQGDYRVDAAVPATPPDVADVATCLRNRIALWSSLSEEVTSVTLTFMGGFVLPGPFAIPLVLFSVEGVPVGWQFVSSANNFARDRTLDRDGLTTTARRWRTPFLSHAATNGTLNMCLAGLRATTFSVQAREL